MAVFSIKPSVRLPEAIINQDSIEMSLVFLIVFGANRKQISNMYVTLYINVIYEFLRMF